MARTSKIKTKGPKSGKTQGPKAQVIPLSSLTKADKKKISEQAKSKPPVDTEAFSISKELKNLRKLVQGKENDLTSVALTRAFLATALESVQIAENAYRAAPHAHNSYALNGLINQARELAADLKALESVNENKAEIITSIVHTVMKRFGFQMIQQINLIKGASDSMSGKDRKRIHRMCDKAGTAIAEYTNATTQSLIEELSK
jgi:hypothetical protein